MATESGLEAAAVAVAAPTPGYERHAEPNVTADVDTALDAVHDAALLERLFADPNSYDFFQAMHLLHHLQPNRAPVGEFADPREEVVRLRTATSVAFPASEIQALARDDDTPQMTVNFLGLTGPQGALPLAYSLYVAERARAGDHALKDFLGIFDHRMLSLFYKAWEKTHVAVGYAKNQNDWLTRHIFDLIGLGSGGLKDRLPIPDETLLFYAGLLATPTRPAEGLEQLLADYFEVPVSVEQFVGGWYSLERATQCELGDDAGASAQLGLGAVAGDEIWDLQSRVRVRIGPLTRDRYDDFLPGGTAHDPLRALTRFYGNDLIDFEIQLVLARDEVPSCRLGADDGAPLPLGWCTWLRTAPMRRDPDDAVFTL